MTSTSSCSTRPGRSRSETDSHDVRPAPGVTTEQLADAAQLSSLADETPEGRSIVVLAKEQYGIRERDVHALKATFVPFTAQTRMSGVDLDGREVRKGAADAIEAYVKAKGSSFPREVRASVEAIAKQGGHPPRRGRGAESPRRRTAQRHRQGGDQRALRRATADGDQDGDDHRRQPSHRQPQSLRRPGSTTYLAEATTRSKVGADSRASKGGAPRRDDRRRDERRSGPRAGRRRGGHEHRHAGRERGRQHGRPRFEPDEAHRGGRDRQAASHDARRAHDVQHRKTTWRSISRSSPPRSQPRTLRSIPSTSCASRRRRARS